MNKIKFAIIKFGGVSNLVDYNRLQSWKSRLFEIRTIYCIANPPVVNNIDNCLDVKYQREQMDGLVSCPDDCDIAVAIMPYRFKDNFYLHRISSNVAVISLYGIKDILTEENISLDNFILKQFYELVAIKYFFSDISIDKVDELVHMDTRGCLFDLNGDRRDILYNTEQPYICDECKSKFKRKQIPTDVIDQFEKELKKLRKPLIVRVERWIRKYPFVSLILSLMSALIINILANCICSFL